MAGSNPACVVGSIVAVIVIIVSIILIAVSFSVMDPNEMGFDHDTIAGVINADKVYEGGRHFLGLGHKFIKYPRTIQSLAIPPAVVRSADGLPITIDLSVQYQLPATYKELRRIYNLFEDDHEDAMGDMIDGLIRDVSTNFTAYQFFENRTALSGATERTLRGFFSTLSINIVEILIVNIRLPPEFAAEIDKTSTAIQESNRALAERQGALVKLQTQNRTIMEDINIANLQRDTQVVNIQNAANSTAQSLLNLYDTEARALASVKNALSLSNEELLAYFFVKTLQSTTANVHMAIGVNPKLIN